MMIFTSAITSLRGLGGSCVALNRSQTGVLRTRLISTAAKQESEAINASHPAAAQKSGIGRVADYVEENAHKFGAWYYAAGLTGVAVSVVYACYRLLDQQVSAKVNHLEQHTSQQFALMSQQFTSLEQHTSQQSALMSQQFASLEKNMSQQFASLEKNISDLRADLRDLKTDARDSRMEFKESLSDLKAEMRMHISMQQNRQATYAQVQKENTPNRVVESN